MQPCRLKINYFNKSRVSYNHLTQELEFKKNNFKKPMKYQKTYDKLLILGNHIVRKSFEAMVNSIFINEC